jgi:hypothetical protein
MPWWSCSVASGNDSAMRRTSACVVIAVDPLAPSTSLAQSQLSKPPSRHGAAGLFTGGIGTDAERVAVRCRSSRSRRCSGPQCRRHRRVWRTPTPTVLPAAPVVHRRAGVASRQLRANRQTRPQLRVYARFVVVAPYSLRDDHLPFVPSVESTVLFFAGERARSARLGREIQPRAPPRRRCPSTSRDIRQLCGPLPERRSRDRSRMWTRTRGCLARSSGSRRVRRRHLAGGGARRAGTSHAKRRQRPLSLRCRRPRRRSPGRTSRRCRPLSSFSGHSSRSSHHRPSRPGGLLAIAALSEVDHGPGPYRAITGALLEAFNPLNVLATDESAGRAWLLARA